MASTTDSNGYGCTDRRRLARQITKPQCAWCSALDDANAMDRWGWMELFNRWRRRFQRMAAKGSGRGIPDGCIKGLTLSHLITFCIQHKAFSLLTANFHQLTSTKWFHLRRCHQRRRRPRLQANELRKRSRRSRLFVAPVRYSICFYKNLVIYDCFLFLVEDFGDILIWFIKIF